QPERLADGELEADAVHRPHLAGLGIEADLHVAEREQRAHAASNWAAKQATRRPGRGSVSAGFSPRQRSMTRGQRAAKAQPAGSSLSGGTMPGMSASRSARAAPGVGVAPIRPAV